MGAEDRLARCIQCALESLGITVSHVAVTDYSPKFFGNHLAHVQTAEGAIRVIFDRQYDIDLLDSGIDRERVPDMVRALAAEFHAFH